MIMETVIATVRPVGGSVNDLNCLGVFFFNLNQSFRVEKMTLEIKVLFHHNLWPHQFLGGQVFQSLVDHGRLVVAHHKLSPGVSHHQLRPHGPFAAFLQSHLQAEDTSSQKYCENHKLLTPQWFHHPTALLFFCLFCLSIICFSLVLGLSLADKTQGHRESRWKHWQSQFFFPFSFNKNFNCCLLSLGSDTRLLIERQFVCFFASASELQSQRTNNFSSRNQCIFAEPT